MCRVAYPNCGKFCLFLFARLLILFPFLAVGCRHGQSEYNVVGRIGGDSELSPHGWAYSKKLAEFVKEEVRRCLYLPVN